MVNLRAIAAAIAVSAHAGFGAALRAAHHTPGVHRTSEASEVGGANHSRRGGNARFKRAAVKARNIKRFRAQCRG